MKILLINSILYTADNNVIPQISSIKDTMIYNMCLGFKELGHNITLWGADDYKPTSEETYDFNVIFAKSSFKKLFLPSVLPLHLSLINYLKKNGDDFDLIISSEVFSMNSLIATIFSPSNLLIWHELAVHTRKLKKIPSLIWYNIVTKLFFRKIPIVARSEQARLFTSHYCKNVVKETVEHGININRFLFNKHKHKHFIVVAQLIPRKNIDSIIRKFYNFVSKFSDQYKLLIVGRGEQEEYLQNLINDLHLEKHAILSGFMEHKELCNLLGQANAMLIDTKQDNNMVSIPESIACGTPIISNRVPTNSSFIAENGVGIVKQEWDEKDLDEIAFNNEQYVQKCRIARDEISNKYQAEKLIKIYFKYK